MAEQLYKILQRHSIEREDPQITMKI